MKEGNAIEIGSPQELEAKDGAFAALKSLQSNDA